MTGEPDSACCRMWQIVSLLPVGMGKCYLPILWGHVSLPAHCHGNIELMCCDCDMRVSHIAIWGGHQLYGVVISCQKRIFFVLVE